MVSIALVMRGMLKTNQTIFHFSEFFNYRGTSKTFALLSLHPFGSGFSFCSILLLSLSSSTFSFGCPIKYVTLFGTWLDDDIDFDILDESFRNKNPEIRRFSNF